MNSVTRHIPNALTCARAIVGVFGSYLLLLSAQATTEVNALRLGQFAALAFIFAAITDGLDGWVARRLNAESPLGALLDPLADKLLIGSYLIVFTIISSFDIWLLIPVAIIIARDLIVTVMRVMISSGPALSVTQSAKFKTAAQMVIVPLPFVFFAVGLQDISVWYHYWIGGIWFLAILTLHSAGPYFITLVKR